MTDADFYMTAAVVAFVLTAAIMLAALVLRLQVARAIERGVAGVGAAVREESGRDRESAEAASRALREELRGGFELQRGAVDHRLRVVGETQAQAAMSLRGEVSGSIKIFGESLKGDIENLSGNLRREFAAFMQELTLRQSSFEVAINDKLQRSAETITDLNRKSSEAHAALKDAVEQKLEKMRVENEVKLEQMRQTVDEKLQSTLEKRIGESFKLVSDRLEHVHRGLGEMQTLAVGVGDLKKVLTNVKDRGGWAEVQLGALLEQMLAPDQYVMNARIDPQTAYVVEYAVRFPGPDDRSVLLPIDSKFPKEDYERLVDAWEVGDADAVRSSLSALEAVIEGEAKKIAEKYVRPPYSTDFAILFVPTEGLYAELLRRPGLQGRLQQKHRVTIAGPTTLAALLTSFQMGFRTLAIQKQSSEAWRVLGEAKMEFEKYAQVWERIGKQLETVQNTVKDAGVRTRAVTRRLRQVETLEIAPQEAPLARLEFESGDDEEDGAKAAE